MRIPNHAGPVVVFPLPTEIQAMEKSELLKPIIHPEIPVILILCYVLMDLRR